MHKIKFAQNIILMDNNINIPKFITNTSTRNWLKSFMNTPLYCHKHPTSAQVILIECQNLNSVNLDQFHYQKPGFMLGVRYAMDKIKFELGSQRSNKQVTTRVYINCKQSTICLTRCKLAVRGPTMLEKSKSVLD